MEKCNYAEAMIWVCYSTFRTVLCRCSCPIKYVKYDSMVNQNKEYNVCVCARARERERERESTVKQEKLRL